MAIRMTVTELKSFINQKLKEARSIEKKIDEKVGEKYKADLDKIIKSSINEFYGSYSPKYYHRKYSLKYMYKITLGKKYIEIDCDPKYTFARHRLGNEEIYDLVFKEGYHGGAYDGEDHPDPGIPYWRTPYPDFIEWGMPAAQSEPPFEIIQRNAKAYEDIAESVLDEIINTEIGKWLG